MGTLRRYYPWLLGLALAPLLFGSVNPEAQAVVGALFGISLFLLASKSGPRPDSFSPPAWSYLAIFVLLLPLIPLPAALVQWIDPQRFALARDFPLEPEALPTWLTLSVSPAGTVQRLWELSLLVACFCLARRGAAHPGLLPRLALAIAGAMLLLAGSELWYRWQGRGSVLGLWKFSWGQPGGTFANRNDFANWLYLGALFCLGLLLRAWQPLLSARPPGLAPRPIPLALLIPICLAVLLAIGMAAASGSRGGLMAFAVGGLAWLVLLRQRSRQRGRWVGIGLGAFVTIVLILAAGGFLFDRLALAKADLGGRYPKLDIWLQSWRLFCQFPWFGTGPGTFVTAFNHFKSGGGAQTFWHAENDYVQQLVETGLTGALVFGVLGRRWIAGTLAAASRERFTEPELLLGAVAGLAAFAAHAAVEFVFQITANALLAATFLGVVAGARDQARAPIVVPAPTRARLLANLAAAGALLAAAALQGVAFVDSWSAHRDAAAGAPRAAGDKLRHSLQLWPWAPGRAIALLRAEAAAMANEPRDRQLARAVEARAEFAASLSRDPLNWELRLERALFDVAYSTNLVRALVETRELIRLNPLQTQLPLYLARAWAPVDRDVALALARGADLSDANRLADALALSWSLTASPALLWSLTPATTDGLTSLGDFALERRLFPLAVEAFQMVARQAPSVELARRFLQARRPDLVASMFPTEPSAPSAKLVLARAEAQLGHYADSIRLSQSLWTASRLSARILARATVTTPLAALEEQRKTAPNDPAVALQLGEKMLELSPSERNLPILNQLAQQFPAEPRLLWLVFVTQSDRLDFPSAAQTALQLAARALGEE